MRFNSIADAIKHYSNEQYALNNLTPYGSLALETGQIPLNTNYINPTPSSFVTYGKSIWGIGQITNISKPII